MTDIYDLFAFLESKNKKEVSLEIKMLLNKKLNEEDLIIKNDLIISYKNRITNLPSHLKVFGILTVYPNKKLQSIGSNTFIEKDCYLNSSSLKYIGDNCKINGDLWIGEDCKLDYLNNLQIKGNLNIADCVLNFISQDLSVDGSIYILGDYYSVNYLNKIPSHLLSKVVSR